ncbi:hypothetical protein Chor_001597, partial [Crotalus horridus]
KCLIDPSHSLCPAGIIHLPYAEIEEPFEAWYNLTGNKSRIEYYNGQVVTLQLGCLEPYGTLFKITPATTEKVVNIQKCFLINGTKESQVKPQGVFPSMKDFKVFSMQSRPSTIELQSLPSSPTFGDQSIFDGSKNHCTFGAPQFFQQTMGNTNIPALLFFNRPEKAVPIENSTWTDPQPIQPALCLSESATSFCRKAAATFVREEYYKNIYTAVWQSTTHWGNKKNIYTMWVTNASCGVTPVHYEMKGYNNLLGSHYDKYEIDYSDFSNSFPASIFVLKSNETQLCDELPGDSTEHHIMANPMADFVGGQEDRAHSLFHHYRKRFGKSYDTEQEMDHRKHTFTHNMRFVHSKNRANLPFKLALNHLADLTLEEMAVMRGKLKSTTPNKGLPFPEEIYTGLILPESLDWRLYGAVTPVKDQAVCGSCWSFSSTGSLEGALFLKNGYCHSNETHLVGKLSSYVNVTSGNATALKAAIYKHGPVSVSIDAAHRTFSFYSNGVYYEPKCKNKRGELDHAVLAVGYGVLQGELYWLIKNSWSTYWGNDGYILMSMKDNNCGVTTDAVFPIMS